MQYIELPKSLASAKLRFMTRLPKKRGITQVEEDKSLILRQVSELKTYTRVPLQAYSPVA